MGGSVSVTVQSGGILKLTNVRTVGSGATSMAFSGSGGAVWLTNCDLNAPYTSGTEGIRRINCRIAGSGVPDSLGGILMEYGSTVTPEGRLAAQVGSMSFGTAGVYKKASGTGDTGWVLL